MMLVTAIVQSFALDDVRAGLDRLDVAGMAVSAASGHGRLHGHPGATAAWTTRWRSCPRCGSSYSSTTTPWTQ